MKKLQDHSIFIGYNLAGQDFFDLCDIYKKYIKEIFFSTETTMPGCALNSNEIIQQLLSCNRYNIPMHLLLNRPEISIEEHIISLHEVLDKMAIVAVSVIDISMAKKIHSLHPDLLVDLSTHSYIRRSEELLEIPFIRAININEPSIGEYDDNFFQTAKKLKIGIKYIVNRACIFGKNKTIASILSSPTFECCKSNAKVIGLCQPILEKYPWTKLLSTQIYKEDLIYRKWINYIKLSTRELSCVDIAKLLSYWTSTKRTERAFDINILSNDRYEKFLEILEFRASCSHVCSKCFKCKTFYEDLVNI